MNHPLQCRSVNYTNLVHEMSDTQITLKDGRRCILRRVRAGDTAKIFDYFLRLSATSRALFHPHPFTTTDAERIARDHNSQRNVRLLAVDAECDLVAGYVFYESALETGGIPVLGIGVADEYQGVGLGRAMMVAIIEKAISDGRLGLDLTVYKTNQRAIDLYASVGFVINGQTSDGKQHTMRLIFASDESTP
jgi:GNAT superfamily N-acetyltransferase